MENIYKIKDLIFSFDKGEPLFRGLDFNVPAKGLTLITGGNGAGKTTLCRFLTGLAKGYKGSILLHGVELADLKQGKIMEEIVHIKQDLPGNLMGITPDDDLRIWQNRFRDEDSESKRDIRREAFNALGIKNLDIMPVWELSYGQKRKTMLSVLPLFMDKFWILDEPTASLDKNGIDQLLLMIEKKLSNQKGLLILTHRPEIFKGMEKRVYSLIEGIVEPEN